jgi:hypothetical protein
MIDLPPTAAWRFEDARLGFEVLFLHHQPAGYLFKGHSTAVEGDVVWSVRYSIRLDSSWATRQVHVIGESGHGMTEVRLERPPACGWRVNGRSVPQLARCVDVDLEASAFTNTFPIHRLGLAVGQSADVPAAWVRAHGLDVELLEQSYVRLEDKIHKRQYDYFAPSFDFSAKLAYDQFGLILDYPGLAVRVA